MTEAQIQKETEEYNRLRDLDLHERVQLTSYISAVRVTTGWLYVNATGHMTFVPESLPQ